MLFWRSLGLDEILKRVVFLESAGDKNLGQFAPEESLFKQDLTVVYRNNAQYYDMVQKKILKIESF